MWHWKSDLFPVSSIDGSIIIYVNNWMSMVLTLWANWNAHRKAVSNRTSFLEVQNVSRSWQGIICRILVILHYIQAWGKRWQVSQILFIVFGTRKHCHTSKQNFVLYMFKFMKMIILVTTHWYYCYQQHTKLLSFCWDTLTNLLMFISVNFWSDDWTGGYYRQILPSGWQKKLYPWENINLET